MNKTVLVTGSSRGIGRAVAKKFSENGYNTALNCKHRETELKEAVLELRKMNPKTCGFLADVGDFKEAGDMFAKLNESFGGADVIVNNAGIAYLGLFQSMKPAEWEEIIRVNLLSVMNCTHAALGHMLKQRNGCIINISSVWGEAGASCEAVYSASKGAVNAFTHALAKELAPSGIRVNAISCGVIDTEMNGFLSRDERQALVESIPAGRMGKSEEIAELAFFLASSGAEYINGQVIRMDGGMI